MTPLEVQCKLETVKPNVFIGTPASRSLEGSLVLIESKEDMCQFLTTVGTIDRESV